MAYFVCQATIAELEVGPCPEWVEVTTITTVGDPVETSAYATVPATWKAEAFAYGALPLFAVMAMVIAVREVIRLLFTASGVQN